MIQSLISKSRKQKPERRKFHASAHPDEPVLVSFHVPASPLCEQSWWKRWPPVRMPRPPTDESSPALRRIPREATPTIALIRQPPAGRRQVVIQTHPPN